MRNRHYTATADFLKRFFGETLHNVELRACANERGPGARSVFSRSESELMGFVKANDKDGWGTYFGTCTRRLEVEDGSARNIVECPALWVDIDCLDQGLSGSETLAALQFLPFPPTIVVNSGGGLHAYWILEELADVTEGSHLREPIVQALRQLAHILAGDSKCADLARIMRLPGSYNSKPKTVALYEGLPALCEVVEDTGRVYDLEALVEWLAEQRAVLHGAKPAPKPLREDDPFVAYARSAGYEPAIDIDAALAAMEHGGHGSSSIHATQLSVSASMIARGYDDDEIVRRIIEATEAKCPAGSTWNWSAEIKAVETMIRTGREKGYDKPRERVAATSSQPLTNGNAALKVVHLEDEREKRAPKPESNRATTDQITLLGSAALSVWQDRYGPIIHSRGSTYAYEDGVWSLWDEQHEQMLRVLLQEACVSIGLAPKPALLGGATLYFMNRPSLLVRDIEFDQHGLIVAGDAVIDPHSQEISSHSPDHRAQFKVGANLEGGRECPAFLKFLEDSFGDKDPDEIPHIIRTIQEWFGASLVANKSRALAKGMLVYGGSRTGKTQLSEVLRALLGRSQTSATSAADIGTDFGLQGFLGKRGWVADDAIGQDEFLDAERYKKIVTGEEIGVRRKNRTDIMARFGFPVMLTANHLPKIRDQSEAVYNRSLVLPMTCVRPEHLPEPIGYHSIAAKVVAEELTGVLWWAIEGWRRLQARGVFTPPPCMTKAVADLQDNNNKVGAWIREAVVIDPASKVACADLFASFAGWYYLENGDGKFPWSQNGFTRRVKEAMPLLGSQAGAKNRNLTGLRLTAEGLEYWSINASRDARDAPKGAALDQFAVNQDYQADRAERAAQQHQAPTILDKEPRF